MSDLHRRLAPGEFIGLMDARIETPSGVVCFIERQPHVEPHEHADTHFVLIADGGYRTLARGAEGAVGAGAVLFNPPGTRHDDQFVGPGRLVTFSLSDRIARLCAEAPIACGGASVVRAPAAAQVLGAIAAEAARWDEVSALSIEGLSLELSAAVGASADAPAKRPVWLARAWARVEEACEDAPSVEELAREAGVHPVHLARAFRRFLGVSPGECLRRARARRAARLLARSRLPLSEVALACGFADQAGFTKAFSRATGLSPGAFRRRWTQ